MRIFSEKRVACVHFPHASFHYRRDAFEEGLRAVGYVIRRNPDNSPNPNDVLVCWNRYNRDEAHCRRYEQAGGIVLIAENSWLGPEEKEAHHFAICRGHHNGAGRWHVGERPRELPGVKLLPWRRDGHSIVVLPQRGMGEKDVRQPPGWLPDVMERLHQRTRRPVVVHYHPGPRPHPPIDFTGAWAAVTWASGAAIKAICAGIPVFYEFKKWIGAPAATYSIDNLEDCFTRDRMPMLHRLSWAQWTAEEIASGEPFKWLLKLG
jgi:hypothetical protein